MRLIDADALPKYTGSDLSAHLVAAAVRNAPTVDAVELKSVYIYGYPLNELALFAIACREAGITEKELRDINYNFEWAFSIARKQTQNAMKEAIENILSNSEAKP